MRVAAATSVAVFAQSNFRARRARKIYLRYRAGLRVARFCQTHARRLNAVKRYRRKVSRRRGVGSRRNAGARGRMTKPVLTNCTTRRIGWDTDGEPVRDRHSGVVQGCKRPGLVPREGLLRVPHPGPVEGGDAEDEGREGGVGGVEVSGGVEGVEGEVGGEEEEGVE